MISLVANVPMVQLAQEFDNIFDNKDETPFYFAKWYRIMAEVSITNECSVTNSQSSLNTGKILATG
jgi:hypothetical protein